jgi:hypothetical protein
MHGIVSSRLVVKLNLEVIQAQPIIIYGGNMASIEAAIVEAGPPVFWDVQVERFGFNGNMLDGIARHC